MQELKDKFARGECLKVVCIGAGYVGAPSSCVLAKQCGNTDVVVVDISEERIRGFNEGRLPIFEPGLEDLVREVRGRNLSFSSDCGRHISGADIVFVSVNTPTKKYGVGAGQAADMSAWENAGRDIAQYATRSMIVVEKSTVPVKTASALKFVLEANAKPGIEFQVLSNPEFLAEGTAIRDLLYPDRVLIGGASTTPEGRFAIEVLVALYSNWVPREKILTMDVWSAELSKLVANSFLAQRISSINAVAMICEKTGADVTDVSRAIGMDTRIGSKFLQPSVGFGGSCFKKDIYNMVYLSRCLGLSAVARYWEAVIDMNELSKNLFKDQIVSLMFNTVRGKKVAIFGFAFKKDTGDVRETPAACVCHGLLEEGAILHIYDPMVTRESAVAEMIDQGYYKEKDFYAMPASPASPPAKSPTSDFDEVSIIPLRRAPPPPKPRRMPTVADRFLFMPTPQQAVQDADAIAIITEWDAFRTLDYRSFFRVMRKPAFIFDGRLLLNHRHLREIGFFVKAIGKPNEISRYDPLPGPLPR